jgi:hypothetical protein
MDVALELNFPPGAGALQVEQNEIQGCTFGVQGPQQTMTDGIWVARSIVPKSELNFLSINRLI